MTPPPLLIRGARVLTPDRQDGQPQEADILIEGGLIAAVGDIAPTPGSAIIDGRGMLAAPGLVNAHMHSQSAMLAGFADAVSHPVFMWLTPAHTARLTPEEIRLTVLASAAQILLTGTTAAIDHFPGQRFSKAQMDAALSAWEETGLRVLLGKRFFDDAFGDILPDGAGPDVAAVLKPQPLDELRAFMPDIVARWHGRAGRLQVAPAPSNPDRCTDAALIFCAELAERHDLAIHTHLLETQRQARLAFARRGKSGVSHLADLGVLSGRWSCAHAIWLDDDDIARMARHGAIAVHNPESNARIGAGAMRTRAMLDAGVPIALGTDGPGANDNLVMHEAMRAAATLHRASEPDRRRWVSAREAFAMATTGGARAMRLDGRIGAIAPGFAADIALYRPDSPTLTPLYDAIAQLVFAETGASVDTVLVGGRALVRASRITAFDAAGALRAIAELPARLRLRNADLFAVAQGVADRLG